MGQTTIEEDDLAAGVEIQELTTTQILRKARDILQIKENQTEKTPELQSKIGQPQQHKDQVIASMIKQHFQDLEGKDAHIRAMTQLHAIKLASKDIEFREMANKTIANRKKSNIVSVFISCCLYNVATFH